MKRLFRILRTAAYWVEDQFDWVFRNPVFPAQIGFILLASWGLVGADLGIERLFWSESWAVQLTSGLAVGMLFGMILVVWYLLDRPDRFIAFAGGPNKPTLFPSRTLVVRTLGSYLFWALPLLLLVLLAGKASVIAMNATRVDPPFDLGAYLKGRLYLLFGPAGYLLAIVLARLLFVADERLGIRDRLTRWPPFTSLAGFGSGRIPPGDLPLHAISAYLALVAMGFIAGAIGVLTITNELMPGRVAISPVVLACLVFILISQVYGYWSFHIRLGTLALVSVAFLLAAWNSTAVFPEAEFKYRFPGLNDYYARGRRVPLAELNRDGYVGDTAPRPGGKDQLRDCDILASISRRWQAVPGQEQTRPKLVVVAVSGGGIRSAVWTAVVLETVEAELKKSSRASLRDHIRLFTGASGGMVGASLFVADFESDWPDRGNPQLDPADARDGLGLRSGVLAEQSLLPVTQTAVTRDFSRNLFVPPWRVVGYERGRSLEDKWALNARARGYGPTGQTAAELESIRASGRKLSPFNRTFADLYPLEAQGLRPSMIFSPMLVEDSRRLLISNLDLSNLASARGPIERPIGAGGVRLDGIYSRSGLEFFKLFPDAHGTFEIGTAARMSATFPVITPAVSLPTIPPRRVVDAGYFDNYGVDLAAMWLIQNRKDLLEHCGGVALIEIRAFPLQERGLRFLPESDPTQSEAAGLLADAVSAVSTPLRALLRARGNTSYHRNNELLAALDHGFNTSTDAADPYFRRFVFELDVDAALNWYLSSEEKRAVAGRFQKDEGARNQAKAFAEWLDSGGGMLR